MMLKLLVLAVCIALPAAAQTRRVDGTGGHQYSLLGGETVGAGANVVSGEFGWPSVTFGYTHGLNYNTDIGLKFDLLFGVEGDTQASKFGVGFRVPLRMTAMRRDRFSVLLHFDPGLKIFTYNPALFGIGFPVGAVFGYQATRETVVAFGVDLGMTLYVAGGGTPAFLISPMFGPAIEYHIDPRLSAGVNTRFGPVINTSGGSDFGFVMQVLLAYRM